MKKLLIIIVFWLSLLLHAEEGKYIIPAIFATSIAGLALGSDKTTDTGLLALKSFILANSTTQVLKANSHRERPNANEGKEFFNGNGFPTFFINPVDCTM